MEKLMEKVKQWIAPLVVGAIAGMILMSTVMGFVSGGTAVEMAEKAAQDAVVAALVPLCVAKAKVDTSALEAMKSASSYQRRTAVEKAGWSMYPEGANYSLKRALDQGCVDMLT